MGTAVLSPQDCLGPPLQRDRESLVGMIYLSTASPGSTRKDLQGSVQTPMPSLTSEFSRRNSGHAGSPVKLSNCSADPSGLSPALTHSNRSNTAAARLPISRSLLTSSSCSSPMSSGLFIPYKPSSDSSIPSIPSLATHAVPNHFPNSLFLPSRSVSAGPAPLHNTHADAERACMGRLCSSAGRYPLRLVEGSGLANGLAPQGTGFESFSLHENALASKFSDARSLRKGLAFARKEPVNGNGGDMLGDIGRRTKEDFVPGNGGVGWDLPRPIGKETEAPRDGKRWLSDNKIAVQNANGGSAKPNATVPFSALALGAKEFLTELKWRADEASSWNISEDPKGDGFPFLKQEEIIGRSHSDASLLQKPVADPLARSHSDASLLQKPVTGPPLEGRLPASLMFPFTDSSALGRKGGVDKRKVGSRPDEPLFQRETVASPCKAEVDLQESLHPSSLAHERWAGPAYTNSPPPSSLPLPKFSLKQLRSSSLELPSSTKHFLVNAEFSDRSGSCPTLACPFTVPVHESAIDMAFATKDLRRILHLDQC